MYAGWKIQFTARGERLISFQFMISSKEKDWHTRFSAPLPLLTDHGHIFSAVLSFWSQKAPEANVKRLIYMFKMGSKGFHDLFYLWDLNKDVKKQTFFANIVQIT